MSDNTETYFDIVWRQFKKNRAAYVSLWALVPIALIAIFAPALASNQPLVYYDGKDYLFPWWHSLFNSEEHVDFVFNLAMLEFVPWVILALIFNVKWKRRGYTARKRFLLAQTQYVGLILAGWAFFSLFPQLTPNNRFSSRTFVNEQVSNENAWGIYPLIPFGPLEQDNRIYFTPPSLRRRFASAFGNGGSPDRTTEAGS